MRKEFLLIFILSSCLVFAQQGKGIIYYGYIQALDLGNAKGPDSNAYMVFNKNQSYYVTAKDSLEKTNIGNAQKSYSKDNATGSIHLGMKVSSQGDQVVYDIKKNTMWSNVLFRKQFYLKEISPKMNWKIEIESKKIGKFTCKKATTTFRGRNYIAWYTTDIAVPFGPWKLNGLPGLILEAYDTTKAVNWYFKSVEYPTKNSQNVSYIKAQKKYKIHSYEEFKIFQIQQRNITIDKQKVVQKMYPNVIFNEPELSAMFLEFD